MLLFLFYMTFIYI